MRAGSMRGGVVLVVLGLLAVLLGGPRAVGQPCEPEWAESTFGLPGVDGTVSCMAAWDDGDGEALYVAGQFSVAGVHHASGIACWDGRSWSPLGSGMNGDVHALAVFDDGNGSALYAAGDFTEAGGVPTQGLARWDGSSWSAVGGGLQGRPRSMIVFDDGDGPALFIGGTLTAAGGEPSGSLVRWDGTQWARPESGTFGGDILAMAVYDHGDGPALYVAGSFRGIGGVSLRHMARWDGSAWHDTTGIFNHPVYTLAVHDDGSGTKLFAGGGFGVSIMSYNGTTWDTVGGGLFGGVQSLAVYDEGDGPRLFAVGGFLYQHGQELAGIARWDGAAWTSVDGGMKVQGFASRASVRALAVFDDGSGPRLAAGGMFETAGDAAGKNIAAWNGQAWSQLGEGFNAPVLAFTEYDDGTGPAIYAAGWFTSAGGQRANHVARWDGQRWQPLDRGVGGGGEEDRVEALAVYDDGNGPMLYAAGKFREASGIPVFNVARWDGSAWSSTGAILNAPAFALATYDDGDGARLYMGGRFGGGSLNYLAQYDGDEWTNAGNPNGGVFALATREEAGVQVLYAGGEFQRIGGFSMPRVARFDGTRWSALAEGVGPNVHALAFFDDGGGEQLYAGGEFSYAGTQTAYGIARWDGTAWHGLADPLVWGSDVYALASMPTTDGNVLVVGGHYNVDADPTIASLATWDGVMWSPLGEPTRGVSTLTPVVRALHQSSPAADGGLLAGGDFITLADKPSAYVGRLGCPPASCRADLDGDGSLTIFDFLAYQNAFDAGDPRADFDGDGQLTIFDFLAFQNAFDAGCP